MKRGGAKGRAAVEARLDAFIRGDYVQVFRTWRADAKSAADKPRRHISNPAIASACALVRDCQISKAVSQLLSVGLANVNDSAVRAQADSKHPTRADEINADWRTYITIDGGAASLSRQVLELEPVIANLKRRKGVGVPGVRNEHLSVLAGAFEDPMAKEAVSAYSELANNIINADMPAWFYALLAVNRLVMPWKKIPPPGEMPDCRPVAVPQTDRVATERALFKSAEAAHAEYLAPQQLGVGVKNGIALLVFGLRELMWMHPEFVFVSLDTRNAHNELAVRCA